MGFLDWLFMVDEEPQTKFCSVCGKPIIKIDELIGYDSRTGDPITRNVIKCPYGEFYNGHFWWTKNSPYIDP